ncbi:hypothetical protein L9F63_027753, partial [Diploptera punctata]
VTNDHCLICDAAVLSATCYNVFGHLRGSDTSRTSLFEKVAEILNRNLRSLSLHSEVICAHCLNLLVEFEQIKHRLYAIQKDVISKFDSTANNHVDQATGKEPCKLVITQEGKVVKQKESVVKKKTVNKENRNKKCGKLKPYVCTVCGKEFRAYSHRVEHMLIHLGEKPWSCKDCGKNFRTKSALKVHAVKHSGERPYTCQQCGKSFTDKYYFEQHCRVHSGIRPFNCTYCQKAFARKKELVIHVKSHTGDKPHKCSSCSKTFAVKSRLVRHIRTHSGFRCEPCNKSFSHRADLRSHQRYHNGENPFRCIHCGKRFASKRSFIIHVRIHLQHKCSECDERFYEQSKLDEHIAEIHKTNPPTEDNTPQVDEVQTLTPVQLESVPQVLQTLAPIPVDSIIPADGLNVQTIPLTQVAQLEWSDGTAGSTSTAYVNIIPGTYVSILN